MRKAVVRTIQSWAVGLATLGAVRAEAAQQGGARFAVLPFENTGSYGQDKEVFEGLELGLPVMIGRVIDRHPGADVIPRTQLADAMRTLNLGPGQRVDASSAAQIGKATGAGYTVTGSFADFYGKFRVNARLVNARSGQIVKVVSNDDPKLQDRAQLAAIVQALGERITTAAGLPPFPSGAAPAPVPTDAITAYSRGLLHETQGDPTKATEFYRSALAADPQLDEAREGLRRLSP